MRSRLAFCARACSARRRAARFSLPSLMRGIITASAAPRTTRPTTLPIASLRHGTGGITTSRGAVQTCSHTPTISRDRRSALISGRSATSTRIHASGHISSRMDARTALARGSRAPVSSACERSRAHPRAREAPGPEHKPEPAEDAAGPLHEFVSNVGNRAFGGAIARTQGAGIMPTGEVHPSVQSTIDSTRGAGSARHGRGRTSSRRHSATSPMSAYTPIDLARAQSRGLGARVRDRQRRLLRAERVQAQHVGRRSA